MLIISNMAQVFSKLSLPHRLGFRRERFTKRCADPYSQAVQEIPFACGDPGIHRNSAPCKDVSGFAMGCRCGQIVCGQEILWRDTTSALDTPGESYPYSYRSWFAQGERRRSCIRKRP